MPDFSAERSKTLLHPVNAGLSELLRNIPQSHFAGAEARKRQLCKNLPLQAFIKMPSLQTPKPARVSALIALRRSRLRKLYGGEIDIRVVRGWRRKVSRE